MAGFGAFLIVTDNVLVAMQSDSFRSLCSPSRLKDFQKTVTVFRECLVEAEAIVEYLTLYSPIVPIDGMEIKMARKVIYDVDDLVHELLTRGHLGRHGCQWLFPHKMQWMFSFELELEKTVNYLREYTEGLKSNGSLKPTIEMTHETHSYVEEDIVFFVKEEEDIVGREDELQAVLQRLLYSSSDVISIVGLRGIGKTTLAKLIYNHPSIESEFPFRLWAPVSQNFDGKMMGTKLRGTIRWREYLLVLDNMGSLDPQEWLSFMNIMPKGGGEGSFKILVTTRLKETAQICDINPYELEGLSQADSWSLLQRLAFDSDHLPPPVSMFQGANQIVHKYWSHHNPLVIRELAKQIRQEPGPTISNIFGTSMSAKVSYYNLESSLKNCFSYCALFPRDFVIDKRMLIRLWMAQGYIVSSEEDRSMEDVGNDCFSVLFEKGFFEVVERAEWGEIVSCKIHESIHSFAQKVAREKLSSESKHELHYPHYSPIRINIRSYLPHDCSPQLVDTLVKQWRSLRTLDLHGLPIKSLPYSIGELLHLRYLDLSHNIYLEALPNSIVKLKNLQTLDMRFCALLKELPQELSRLSALRCLDMFGCDGLTRMPPGMEKLTCLRHLSLFVAAEGISGAEIRDLKKLVSLRGRISISIPRSYTNVKRIDWNGGCLEAHKHLREVWVRFLESHFVDNSDQRVANYHQIVLEKLQPHGNIKKLMLWGYQGAIIAKWGRAEDNWADTLGCLVVIELRSCEKLKQLPKLSNLPHLKSLKLHGLRELEYLENAAISSTAKEARTFFPSLQELEITNAPKLRGFWDIANCATFPLSLIRIELSSCEKLQQLPFLSNHPLLKSLKLYGLSNLEGKIFSSTASSSVPEADTTFLPSLEELEIVDAPKLKGFGSVIASHEASCFRSLKSLVLANLLELRTFYCLEGGDDGQNTKHDDHPYTLHFCCLSKLRVSNCPKLMSMPLVPTLEVLEAVTIHADLLKHIVGSQGFGASSSTSSTLQQVDIVAIRELHDFPVCLSNVESLTIRQCELLEILALGTHSYIKRLTIQECGRLKHILPRLDHLSCLKELEIEDCEDLDWNITDDVGSGIVLQNLKTFTLNNISKCEYLTKVLGYLTTLEKLSLSWLYDLRSLPNEIALLVNLSHLTIRCCPNLTVLPESLGRLPLLKKLEIECCSRLKHLPEFLPSKSFQVVIRNCPQLSSSVS